MLQSQLKKILVDRELSWLDFNERVLITAEQDDMPLMERLKFLGIFSSNLDEFYSVRVGSLTRMLHDASQSSLVNTREIRRVINTILERVTGFSRRVEVLFPRITEQLKQHNIHFETDTTVTDEQKRYIEQYFTKRVRSKLFPIMLRRNREFPFLKNVSIYLVVSMYRADDPEVYQYALIEVPETVPRYVQLPSEEGRISFIILDDIIRLHLKTIFSSLDYDAFEAYTIKITRDAEYSLDEEVTKSLYEKLSESIRQRTAGVPVRVVYDEAMPGHLWEFLLHHAQLHECENHIAGGRYHNMRDMISFPHIRASQLYFRRQPPLLHHTLDNSTSIIRQVMERDYLLTMPFHRFGYIIDLLREASIDPLVTTIKMTLYRVANDSSIINALVNAARNGKRVVVFIEVQARFNEAENLHWTEMLSAEKNVTLISSLEGLKVHSKICVITRKSEHKGKNARIAVISTGNFNEKTAELYCDHLLLTASPKISNEVNKVFKQLSSNFQVFKFKSLLVSPAYLRNRITTLIKHEIANAKAGRSSGILIKLNNLVDTQMIKWLCMASQAGVPVRLLVRGICAFTPGVQDISDKISVTAMIDRYLEHTRVYRFTNAGEPKFFIGSSDLMPRNLDRRVEVLSPVLDPQLIAELEHFLDEHLQDSYSSFTIDAVENNRLLRKPDVTGERAQVALYGYYRDLVSGKREGEAKP